VSTVARGSAVTVRSPAKINLDLRVGPPRSDGYHALATVYQAVSLFDRVTASPASQPGRVSLDVVAGDETVVGPLADVPTDDRNLAVRAVRLLAEHTGATAGVHLRLRKAIPVAAGLAGGSSDAAAALVACDVFWGTGLARAELVALAAELGSDVPFCVDGGTAHGAGRGEVVTPLDVRGSYWWVLALAHGGLSTPAVYAHLDRMRGSDAPDPRVSADVVEALGCGDAKALGRALSNDLQPAALALRPELAEVLAAGEGRGALGSLVSGSGPSCVFLAVDGGHAGDIADGLREADVCRAVQVAQGPVPGARVVDT
jgi:4-diphosphocytidyl-2-C-methyl-D-erythritol kinase